MTHDQYINQLSEIYPDDICVVISLEGGYIAITAPWENGWKYSEPCGVLSIGAYDLMRESEIIIIDGKSYYSHDPELREQNEAVTGEDDLATLALTDGITIRSVSYTKDRDDEDSYRAYLETKEVLWQIVSSFIRTDSSNGD